MIMTMYDTMENTMENTPSNIISFYTKVYDGASIHSEVLTTLCGTNRGPEIIATKGRSLLVVMTTDDRHEGTGFIATVDFWEDTLMLFISIMENIGWVDLN